MKSKGHQQMGKREWLENAWEKGKEGHRRNKRPQQRNEKALAPPQAEGTVEWQSLPGGAQSSGHKCHSRSEEQLSSE